MQTEGSRFKAWAVRACFTIWSLGGNQTSDKHRTVPPFYIYFFSYENAKIWIIGHADDVGL